MKYEAEYEETIIRGDTWDGNQYTVTRAGTDYTYATIKAHFRTAPDKPLLLEKEIEADSIAEGQIVFTLGLTAAESALFDSSVVYSDIEIATPTVTKTPIFIKFNVVRDITV